MKIVLATPLFPPEIAEPAPYVKDLAERLCGTQQVTVVAYTNFTETIPGMTLVAVNKRRTLPVRLLAFTLALFNASKGAEVIFSQGALAAGLPSVLVGAVRRIPVVIQLREDEAWERARRLGLTKLTREGFLQAPPADRRLRLIRWLQSLVLRRAKRVVAPSSAFAALLVRVYGLQGERIVVDLYPPETPQVLPFPIEPVPYQVLTSSSDISWTEVASVVRAIARLTQRFPRIMLVVVGDGPEEGHLRALVEDLNVAPYVSFVGRVSRAEFWYLRKSSAVLVATATDASLPDAAVQGFAAGVPVVATGGGGLEEVVKDGVSGSIVGPADDNALARAIERLLSDEAFRLKVLEGSKKVLQDISWGAHVANLLRIFGEVTH